MKKLIVNSCAVVIGFVLLVTLLTGYHNPMVYKQHIYNDRNLDVNGLHVGKQIEQFIDIIIINITW